jgi:hypothetical protein
MKYHFITYGYPEQYYNTGLKLVESANSFFDTCSVYTKSDIDKEFLEKNPILNESRGAGYWVWKPYFIQKKLLEVEDNDVVFYTDCRCLFISDPRSTIDTYFTNPITAFHVPGDFRNFQYTKRQCFESMNMRELKYINGRQYNGAVQIYRKCKKSKEFIDEYLYYCCIPLCINDTVEGYQHSNFREHRHDQSIFSNLCIKYGISAHKSPCQWGEKVKEEYPFDKYNAFIDHHRNFR